LIRRHANPIPIVIPGLVNEMLPEVNAARPESRSAPQQSSPSPGRLSQYVQDQPIAQSIDYRAL
jgi:hypothetical protein